MFARVSTYKTSPDTSGEPTEETVRQVLELPGCLGIYYLKGKDGKALSITLWNSEEDLARSEQPAGKIRSETTAAQNMQVLEVDGYEVLTRQLKE